MKNMKNKPLISVIVPVYKVEKELNRCIESIVHQTYTNTDIILVDDGSPDACPEICDSWTQKDMRIRVLHMENQGLSAARNMGVANAKGELIAFVDSDDYVDACFLEKLVAAMMKTSADVSCCGIEEEDEASGDGEDVTPFASDVCLSSQRMIRDVSFYKWQYVVAWNKLYKKELWDSISFPVGRCHEDESVYHHLLLNTNKIAFVHTPLYHYVQREGSIMKTLSPKRLVDLIYVMNERIYTLKDMRGCESVLQFAYERIVGEYSSYIANDFKVGDISVKELNALCKKSAWLIPIRGISFKKKINTLGFRISPYFYVKAKLFIKRILQ